MRILIVEDDPELRAAVARRLRAVGYAADESPNLTEAQHLYAVSDYDLVILDRGLPDGDSIGLLTRWRGSGLTTPVIFLTALAHLNERIQGLSSGADDYLVKPFAMEELLARVAVLLRRSGTLRATVVRVGDLTIDMARREVRRGDVLLPLRPKEYCVLDLLAARVGTVVSRAEIIEHCWDTNYEPFSNVDESVIASLRRKLGLPHVIHTVRGGGYRLDGPA